jgi:bifunctional non-homologous end joining protein LigD
MIPTARKAPFNDADWIFELKYDGFRVLGTKDGTRTSLLSRKGNELIGAFPEISVAMNALPDLVLDGELVVLDTEGRPRFDRLRRRSAMRNPITMMQAARDDPAVVFAFDLLELRGKDQRKLPLLKRKEALRKTLKGIDRIVCTEHIGEDGERLFHAAEQLGLEGVIGKRADSTYVSGRSPNWVKIKTAAGRQVDEERAKVRR